MKRTILRAITLASFMSLTLWLAGLYEGPAYGQGGAAPPAAQGPARGGRGGPAVPQTARAQSTNDLTGYWISVVTEDWRWLMAVPPKGNADSIALSPAGRAVLDAWDPAKDEAEGNQCKGYGAGAISRLPTRARVTWQDENTLKWETDQGMQTRLFKFGACSPGSCNKSRTAFMARRFRRDMGTGGRRRTWWPWRRRWSGCFSSWWSGWFAGRSPRSDR